MKNHFNVFLAKKEHCETVEWIKDAVNTDVATTKYYSYQISNVIIFYFVLYYIILYYTTLIILIFLRSIFCKHLTFNASKIKSSKLSHAHFIKGYYYL